MIPTIFCLTGIGLCITKHYGWGIASLVMAFLTMFVAAT